MNGKEYLKSIHIQDDVIKARNDLYRIPMSELLDNYVEKLKQLKQKQKSGFWNNFKIGLRLQG